MHETTTLERPLRSATVPAARAGEPERAGVHPRPDEEIDLDAAARRLLAEADRTAQRARMPGWLHRIMQIDPLLSLFRRLPQALWWWLNYDPLLRWAVGPTTQSKVAAFKILVGGRADEYLEKAIDADEAVRAERLALLKRYANEEKIRRLCDEWLALPEEQRTRRMHLLRLIIEVATDRELNARYSESWRWRVAAVQSLRRMWQATDEPNERAALLEGFKTIGYRDRSPDVLVELVRAIRAILEPVYRRRLGMRDDLQVEQARLHLLSGLTKPTALHSFEYNGVERSRPARFVLSDQEERQLGLILLHHYHGSRPDVRGEVALTYAILEQYRGAMRLPRGGRSLAAAR